MDRLIVVYCCLMIIVVRWNSYKYTQGDRFNLGSDGT